LSRSRRIAGFPRTYRFVLGERIGHLAIDILEYLLEATYTRHKKPALDRANLGLEKLRHLLRSGCELRFLLWVCRPKRRLSVMTPDRPCLWQDTAGNLD
jgi:hypothetical protein